MDPKLIVKPYYAPPQAHAVASTLIVGPTEAILVDTQFTLPEGKIVADWVAREGRKLKAIYLTHGHPDHYFGTQSILDRFPGTPVFATPEVLAEMRESHAEKVARNKPKLGDAIPTDMPPVTEIRESALTLDGERVEILKLPAGDSAAATALWIPSLRTLVAGDIVFGHAHLWLASADAAQRKKWLDALRQLKALGAERVICGHRGETHSESPGYIEETAQYIHDFEAALSSATSKDDLVDRMADKHGTRGLPHVLDIAATVWAPK